jgi:hypothetical protein
MERRDFVRVCSAFAAGAAAPRAGVGATLPSRSYPRARLVDEARAPIQLARLRVGVNYVFDYPFSATPCFLLRLDRPRPAGSSSRPRR